MGQTEDAVAAELLAEIIDVRADVLLRLRAEPWSHYTVTKKRKRSGGHRTLRKPCALLKLIQRRLLRTVLRQIGQQDAAHCRNNRSIVSSAWAHVGHSHFATFDIEDCFGSITPQMVQQALHRSGVDRRLVPLITGLCTFRGSLPQGAPTSMAILNAALLPLDTRIAAAAEQHGVAYTRFADDLVVSANRNIRFFGRIVEHELSNLRLRPARQKTRYWPAGKWPVINGVVVGDRPRIPAAYLRWTAKLIAELADATSSPDSTELLRLRGRVAWIESVEPKAGRRLAAELATSPAFRHSGVQIPA